MDGVNNWCMCYWIFCWKCWWRFWIFCWRCWWRLWYSNKIYNQLSNTPKQYRSSSFPLSTSKIKSVSVSENIHYSKYKSRTIRERNEIVSWKGVLQNALEIDICPHKNTVLSPAVVRFTLIDPQTGPGRKREEKQCSEKEEKTRLVPWSTQMACIHIRIFSVDKEYQKVKTSDLVHRSLIHLYSKKRDCTLPVTLGSISLLNFQSEGSKHQAYNVYISHHYSWEIEHILLTIGFSQQNTWEPSPLNIVSLHFIVSIFYLTFLLNSSQRTYPLVVLKEQLIEQQCGKKEEEEEKMALKTSS